MITKEGLRAAALSFLVLFASGCDRKAPPQPFLELLPEVSSRVVLAVEGIAEPGSTVRIAREPVFETDAPAAEVADPISGRFRFMVPLAAGVENTLSIVAVDKKENVSEPATVVVIQEPARPEWVRLDIPRPIITTDEGLLTVHVTVGNHDPMIEVEGMQVEVVVQDYPVAVANQTVSVNASGVAELVLAGFEQVGQGVVVATATQGAPDGSAASDQRSFGVLAGRPALAEVLLSATVAGASVGPATSIVVPAGTEVDAAIAVSDAAGNTIDAPGVTVTTDAPGALVAGTHLQGLEQVGVYRVFATVQGSIVSGQADLEVVPAAGTSIVLTLGKSVIKAGQTVSASAAVLDAYGNITGDAVTLSENLPVYQAGTPAEDPQDFVNLQSVGGATLGELTVKTAGTFQVVASAAGVSDVGAGLSVVPAVPSTFAFALGSLASPINGYPAGAVVPYGYAVTDAFGNDTHSTVLVSVPAPSVVVTDDGLGGGEILGVVRAATYTVRARVLGTLLEGTETLIIDPAPAEGFNLVLSSPLSVVGSRVLISVIDAWGNVIPMSDVAIAINGIDVASSTEASLAGRELTFNQAGTYTISATLLADSTITDSELVAVQGVVDTLPPTASIDAVLFPGGTTVGARSRVEVQVSLGDDRALGEFSVYAVFGIGALCTTQVGPFFLSGALTSTLPVTFRVPGCAIPGDQVQIVARVSDQAGNVGYSPPDLTLTVFVPGFGNITSPGYSAVIAGYRDRIAQPDQPLDVAVDPLSGVAFITLANNNRVIVIFPDRTQDDLRDANRNRINFNAPYGVALDPNGSLYVGDVGNGQVDRVQPTLTVDRNVIGGVNAWRMTLDTTNPIPLLCLVDNLSIDCYADFRTPTPTWALGFSPGQLAAAGFNNPTGVAFTGNRLWIVDAACNVGYATLSYDPIAGTVTAGAITLVTPVGPAAFGGACMDIAGLPSGDVAIADAVSSQVLRLSPAGDLTTIATGLPGVTGLDFAGNKLYVLDATLEALFMISGVF